MESRCHYSFLKDMQESRSMKEEWEVEEWKKETKVCFHFN